MLKDFSPYNCIVFFNLNIPFVKQLYIFLFVLFSFYTNAQNSLQLAPPVVDFTFNNNSACAGTIVNFVSNATGDVPLTYLWDFGDSTTSTLANPSHTFSSFGCGTQNFNVRLTVTDVNNTATIVNHIVSVKQKPDLNFTEANTLFPPYFDNCSSASSNYSITVANSSPSNSCINSYSVNWGDGNTQNNASFPLTHTYSQLGVYTMTINAIGSNGCATSKTYIVKNVSNPSGGLVSPGSTQNLCAPTTNLQFAISNWGTNSLDTTYQIDYGDGTTPLTFTQATLEASTFFNSTNPSASQNFPIPHSYTVTSCPGGSFTATLIVTNACSATPFTTSNIVVLKKPIANFTAPIIGCTSNNITFTNTTVSGYSQGCNQQAIYTWDFGDGTPIVNVPLGMPQNITHQFATAGNYTVTLTAQGFCGISAVTHSICIEGPTTPSFTLNTNNGCTPQTVTTNNTTTVSNACIPATYQWNVIYASGNCGSGATPPFFAAGSTATSTNPIFNFTTPGNYTISLTATNSCGSVTSASQTVIVKQPPTAIINPINDFCGIGSISPTAVINGCAPAGANLTYAWSFPGGAPATANTANPGTIVYNATGTFTVSLTVTNDCGASAVSTEVFTINVAPTITNTSLTQTICSGMQTSAVVLAAVPATATFTWTATATPGVTGFMASGNGNIPMQTITTSAATTGTVTYQITPSAGACPGTVVSYTVIVNPAPNFTTQPASSTACQGGIPIVLTVALSNATAPQYQWYSNTANSTLGGTLIPGATNASYAPPSGTIGILYYYCVVTLSSGGCATIVSNVAQVDITAPVTISLQPITTQNICVGGSIAALTLNYSGGTGTVSYQWFSNTTSSNTGGSAILGAISNTYTPPAFASSGRFYYYAEVTLTGNNCGTVATTIAEVVVSADPVISVQPLVTQTLCQGVAPTLLSVTATGGIGSLNYQWYSSTLNNTTTGIAISGATSNTFLPSVAVTGTLYYYCLISQSADGCAVLSATSEVIVMASPVITTQPQSHSTCHGGTVPALTLAYANGVGTPAYQWYSNLINDNTTGTPVVGAITDTYVPLSTAIGTLYYYCIITLPPSGGCSAIVSNTAEIVVTAGIAIDVQPLPLQDLCVGATIPIALTATYTGGTGTPSWQWYSNTSLSNTGGTLISGATTDSFTPPTFTATGTFYFYATVSLSGSGCGLVATDPAAVNVVADPVITTQPLASQTHCQNALPQTLGVIASGGVAGMAYSYQWYSNTANNNTTGTIITAATGDTYIPDTSNTGTIWYYCIVTQPTAQGCQTNSTTAEVIVNLAPTFTTQPVSNMLCIGQTTPSLNVAYTNGVGIPQYQWYANTVNSTIGGTLIIGETAAVFNPSVTNIGTMFYYCIVTLPVGGCSAITSDIAEIIINPIALIADVNPIICSGNPFLITPETIVGNTVPIGTTYTWATPIVNPSGSVTGFAAETLPQAVISQTLTNTTLSPATVTYTITPLSGSCIGADFTITVTVNPSISPGVTITDSKCYLANNGVIDTNITGGIPFPTGPSYGINWTGPNGFTASSADISNLPPGSYILTVNDAGGCPFTQSYTVTEPAEIIITTNLEKDITCFNDADGAVTITVAGGTLPYSYTWLKDTLPFTTTDNISNLSPGVYSVSVTDANNCGPATAIFTITEPPLLAVSLTAQTNILCYGYATGMVVINVTGGTPIQLSPGVFDYSYAWTGPDSFTAATQNLTNVRAGTYNLTVTDANGCLQNISVTLTQPAEILITATTTPITCYGANNASISLAISGGVAPYNTTWSNFATGTFQNNLAAGTYTITVTDATNCPKIINVVIPEAPLFLITPVVTNISCYGAQDASINLNFVGGINPIALSWNDGSTSGTVRNNLGPGTYTVTIIDGTPCTINRTFVIVEPQPLALTANTTNAFDCNDANSGAINLLVSGGTPPFSYAWSNGAATEDLSNIPAGNYQVTVTDAHGCSKTETYIISRQPPILIDIKTETTVDCAAHTVMQRFVAEVSGGIPPYVLSWSSGTISGSNNEIMQTNTNGAVVLIVTDSRGCTANHTINVDTPVLGYNTFDTASYAYSTYGIYSVIDPVQFHSEVTGDYTGISWDFGDGTFSTELHPSHAYTNPGDYIVTQTVTYPFGCIYIHKISLLVEKGYLLVVPTAFTPNGDSLNDYFRPVTKALKNVHLDIYDTWGSLIYSESGEILKGWDAKIKGFEAENGNYYTKVRAETFYGTIVKEEHPFVLIK